MPTATTKSARRSRSRFSVNDQPTWELAYFFPAQGAWTEQDYLTLEDHLGDKIRVELSEGRLEFLPMPTEPHQLIIAFLWKLLDRFVELHAPGAVLFAGIRVKLRLGKKSKFREPDVVYMKAQHARRRHKEYWDGADLAMEVVSGSPKDRARDWKIKPREYAAAGIPEYWIIDPEKQIIRVWSRPKGKVYTKHQDFGLGDQAASVLLAGFAVAVDAVFAAARS